MTTLELTTGTTRRPKMTAEQAQSFERFSLNNAAILAGAAAARGCECQAYSDWFTYNRWVAQGQQVQRGEHGTKISTYVHGVKTGDDGKEVEYKFPRTSTVFCRHQVAPAKGSENA